MKKSLLIFLFIPALWINASAQDSNQKNRPDKPNRERAHQTEPNNSKEMAEFLEIDEKTAIRTWEIFSQFQKSRTELKGKSSIGKKFRGEEKPSEADLEKMYLSKLSYERSLLELKERYFKTLIQIIPASKATKLLNSREKKEMPSSPTLERIQKQ